MVYYVIIRGPLGIGKSTVARKLADKLNAQYISIDKVLENHNLDKVEGRAIPLRNFLKANELIFPVAKETIREHRPVVFDGNFYYKKQLSDLEYLMNMVLGVPQHAFTLKASLDTCIKRDSQRKKPLGPDATKAVYNLVTKFNYGKTINTEGKTADEVAEKIQEDITGRRLRYTRTF